VAGKDLEGSDCDLIEMELRRGRRKTTKIRSEDDQGLYPGSKQVLPLDVYSMTTIPA
jgi:hypothetical protein